MTPAQFWQIEMQNQQNQQAQQQQNQKMIMDGITQFAGAYADNKAMEAKGSAYGDFLKRHGEQLGLDGEYLDGLLKMKPRELAVAGDSFLGMGNAGNRLMGLNSMQYQANLYSGNRGSGGGGGGMGSGGAAPQESVTF
jgi:hypothetical protein